MPEQLFRYEPTTCLVCGAEVLVAFGRDCHAILEERQLGAQDGFRTVKLPHACPPFEVETWFDRVTLSLRSPLRVVTPGDRDERGWLDGH